MYARSRETRAVGTIRHVPPWSVRRDDSRSRVITFDSKDSRLSGHAHRAYEHVPAGGVGRVNGGGGGLCHINREPGHHYGH